MAEKAQRDGLQQTGQRTGEKARQMGQEQTGGQTSGVATVPVPWEREGKPGARWIDSCQCLSS